MSTTTDIAPRLRRLYFARFGFALVWAGLLLATASTAGALTAILVVLYPLVDLVAVIVDARSSRATTAAAGLYVNGTISLLAAAAMAFAASSGVPAILRVWGIWAIVSGLVQLIVGIGRRGMGGQWPMMVSGTISVFAGTSFVLQAGGMGASLATLAGYATLGGLFFLVSALRLSRLARVRVRGGYGLADGQ